MKAILLALAGLIASVFFYEEAHITSIISYHDKNIFTSFAPGAIVAGEKIQGAFVATNDNLGTVKLRIRTFNRMNTTHVAFQLRSEGSAVWQVTNDYATDRFVDGLLYPFGFPPIAHSKGNTYEFELTSVDGEKDNAIGLSSGYHAVASQYVSNKKVLLADKARAMEFIKEKLKSMVSDPFLWLYEGMFLIPALALIVKRRVILVVYLVFAYVYLPVDMHSNIILYIAATGLLIAYLAKASSWAMFVAGMVCLLQIPLMIAVGNTLAANRLATLVFFSLILGVMMAWRELKHYQHV